MYKEINKEEWKSGMSSGSYSGKQEHVRNLDLPKLEVVENKFQDIEFTSKLITKEMNSVCPKTGLPDFGTIELSYIPNKVVIEEKSFKMYLTAYRNIGIFKEFATANIFKDFIEACKPKWGKIHVHWLERGGISSDIYIMFDGKKMFGIKNEENNNIK